MVDTVILQKSATFPPMKNGEWFATNKSIFVRCMGCGQLLTLDDHTVNPDGTITPSLVCPYVSEGCTWHVMGKLEGFTTKPENAK